MAFHLMLSAMRHKNDAYARDLQRRAEMHRAEMHREEEERPVMRLIEAIRDKCDVAVLELRMKDVVNVNRGVKMHDTPLIEAILARCDLAVLAFLVKHGADVDKVGHLSTPLIAAISSKCDVTVLDLLVKHGADVNKADGEHRTPLATATVAGCDVTVLELLIKYGADVNKTYGDQYTPLTAAAVAGCDVTVLELLINHGADVNKADGGRRMPLTAAVVAGCDMTVLELLIKHGADIDKADGGHRTPLTALTMAGCDETVLELLMEYGANVNKADGSRHTPLTTAIVAGCDVTVLELLIKHGAKVNKIDVFAPLTAAIWKMCDIVVIKFLIENGADVNQEDRNHFTPLTAAIQAKRDVTVFQLLIDSKADVSRGERHSPILVTAICRGCDIAVLELLINHGADVNKEDRNHYTPLTAAIQAKRDVTVFQLLIDSKADVSRAELESPILVAAICRGCDVAVLELLIDHGADVNREDRNHYTPLTAAFQANRDVTVFQLLIDSGADVSRAERHSSLLLTAIDCDVAVLDLLIKHGADVNYEADDFHASVLTEAVLAGYEGAILVTMIQYGADLTKLSEHDFSSMTDRIGERPDLNLSPEQVRSSQRRMKKFLRFASAILAGANFSTVRNILDHGGDVHETDSGEFTPLIAAICSKADLSVLTCLLDEGADANAQNSEGDTALHRALKANVPRPKIVEYIHRLIDAGCDISLKNKAGLSCLKMAQSYRNDHDRQAILAAMYDKPPPPSVMETGEWYRTSFYNGQDILKLVRKHPEMESSQMKGFTYLPVQRVTREEAKKTLALMEEAYNMAASPRGRAIIINIREFTGMPDKTRHGTEHDVRRLVDLFNQLGFDVEKWDTPTHCTAESLKKMMKEEKSHPTHSNADAFICVVMSHGSKKGVLRTSDWKEIDVKKELVSAFDGNNWTRMVGKPKIFLCQMCRGDKHADVVTAEDDDDDEHEDDGMDLPSVRETHPKKDIAVIYSTYEGYKAKRGTGLTNDPENYSVKGSWFVQEFVMICEMFAHQEHLGDLVAKANRLLRNRVNVLCETQAAQYDSSLEKKLYFFPGYYHDDMPQEKKKCVIM